MADIADQIGKVPLKGIAMPGTHDSAMYQGLPDADWAKNQEVDFTGQLNAGARWFDMRLGYFTYNSLVGGTYFPEGSSTTCDIWNLPTQSDYYMYGHSNICTSVRVTDALDQIKSFLDSHPKEIVILDIRPWVGTNRTSEFAKLLEDHLSPYIYLSNCAQTEGACSGVTPPQVLTPEDLWRSNKRVILLRDASGLCGLTDEMWEPGSMVATSDGYRFDSGIDGDTDYQISFMETEMDKVRPAWRSYNTQPTMLQTSAPLTPAGWLGGAGCLSHCLDGPIGLAHWLNPALVSKVQGDWNSRALNVITVDDITCCGIAEAIVNFNNQQWIPIFASAKDIGAGKDGSVWKIDGSGTGPDYGISFFNGSGWYTAQNKRAVRIAVDPNGLPWVVDSKGIIWRLKASTLSSVQSGKSGTDLWDLMPGVAKDIGIGSDGSIWVIGSNNGLFRFNGSNWDMLPGFGAGHRVAVDNSGRPLVIGTDDFGIYRYDGQKWVRYADGDFTKALDIGAGADGSVWVGGTDAKSVGGVWKWNGTGWDRFRGDATAISVDASGSPWVATSGGGMEVGKIR
jgi:hypothetical protein